MSPTRADVLALILASPDGITSRELARRCNYPLQSVSTKASKLAAYGVIDKIPIAGGNGKALWKAREVAA